MTRHDNTAETDASIVCLSPGKGGWPWVHKLNTDQWTEIGSHRPQATGKVTELVCGQYPELAATDSNLSYDMGRHCELGLL